MMRNLLNLLLIVVIFQVESTQGTNPQSDLIFLNSIRSQCPSWIDLSPPSEVSGETLVKELTIAPKGTFYAIFFYSSKSPFSTDVKPYFDSLSTMFPHIKHLSVEESSAMPSLFSKYGIRGLPALLLTNGTKVVRYIGTKNLEPFVEFYQDITGQSPITYITINQQIKSSQNPNPKSLSETIKEPYIFVSLAFIFLKTIIKVTPIIISLIKSMLPSLNQYLNSNSLWERMLQIVNINKIWSKIRVSNQTRNFRKGASNARVWASNIF